MLACANEFIVQSRIHAAGGKEGAVRSSFDDATLVQHKHEVSFAYCAETMGHNKCSAASQQKFERSLET